jgi:membrane-bound lytic murein transglycosylase A
MRNGLQWLVGLAIVATLAACSVGPRAPDAPTRPSVTPPRDLGPLTGSLAHPKSRWVPVGWSELPGFGEDPLHEAWIALLANCVRPNAALRRCAATCASWPLPPPKSSASG